MGSWNHTCLISNLHIYSGQKVAVFLIAKNLEKISNFCYSNSLYTPCILPFYGEYDDYGGVEKCHGSSLEIILEELKNKLFEIEAGENRYHDIAVKKDKFDIDLLFHADHESRLGISTIGPFMDFYGTEYRTLQKSIGIRTPTKKEQDALNLLSEKLKNAEPSFQQVNHVVIHGDILDAILKDWYIETYVGTQKGKHGYENSYNHVYFEDVLDSIPETIDLLMEEYATGDVFPMFLFSKLSEFRGTNQVCAYLSSYHSRQYDYSIVELDKIIHNLCEEKKWDSIKNILEDAMVGMWISAYMSYTRKTWIPQTGQGSQNSDALGYEVLINAMSNILKKEKEELEEDEE